ncbi:hypothetical protein [Luteolibacter sp. Populi]|uniref:hypothetical protein n=1 Tax=Luteolibacter sp. Populi TaxID=3230487 RepID=UPI0034650517
MKPAYLWLLLPLAAWSGYKTAPPRAAGSVPAAAAEAPDPQVLAMAAELAKAQPADLEKQLRELLAQAESPGWMNRLKLICARWAETDPAGALAWCEANKTPTVVRLRILTEWALLDSDAAWAAVTNDEERVSITRMLLNEDRETFMVWFRQVRKPLPDLDPAWALLAERHGKELEEIATALLGESQDPPGSFSSLALYFRLAAQARADRDPAAAIAWAMGLDERVARVTVEAAFRQWGKKDPVAAWKEIAKVNAAAAPEAGDEAPKEKPPIRISGSVGSEILERLAKDDPAAAIELLREPGAFTRGEGLNGISAMETAFRDLLAEGKVKPLEAYEMIAFSDPTLGLNIFPDIWRGLPAEKLAEAAKALVAQPAGDPLSMAISGVAGAWMAKDPVAAAAFIAAFPDENLRRSMYSGSFDASGSDPARQAEVLAAIPAQDRAAVFAIYLSRFGELRPGEQSPGYAGPELKPELLAPVFRDLPASEYLDQSVKITAMNWGQQDPTAALAWVDSLSDPAARKAAYGAAYGAAFEGWTFKNPNAAAAWLADKKDGPERDAAALPVVRSLVRTDAEVAWEWAESIGDTGIRQEARLAAMKVWALRDREAAQAAYKRISGKLPAADAAKLSACFGGS